MHLTTTGFPSAEAGTFDNLLYVCYKSDGERIVHFKADLNDHLQTARFFSELAKFVRTEKVRRAVDDCYQFAVMHDGVVTPIIWFDLHIARKQISTFAPFSLMSREVFISHDHAFSTTMIAKNGIDVPLGKFPFNKHVSLYREFKLKARAYKFIANQIMRSESQVDWDYDMGDDDVNPID